MNLIKSNELTMSSREIAELTNKEHKNVKRDIKNMFDQLEISSLNFEHTYLDVQNKKQTEYLLPKKYIECLLTGYSIPLRMKVIERMHELENKVQSNIPNFLDPAEAAIAWAEQYKKSQLLEEKVALDAPKVAFMDRFVDTSTTKSLRETAKILKMSERAMIDTLIEDRILFRQSGNLLPYSNFAQNGCFEVKTGEANGHAYTQTRVTTKGMSYIAKRYASELMVA